LETLISGPKTGDDVRVRSPGEGAGVEGGQERSAPRLFPFARQGEPG